MPEKFVAIKPKQKKGASYLVNGGWIGTIARKTAGTKTGKKVTQQTLAKIKPSGGLPIDSQGRIDLSQLAAQRLNFLDQYNQQMADLNHNYQLQTQRTQENEPYVERGILSDYAGRGMAHSSGYGDALGRQTQLYNQNLADLNYAHTYGLQDLNTQKADLNRTLATQQLAIRQAAADRMAAQAGTLGQGKSKPISKKRINHILGIHR